jgi:glycosyltransferase involved in cell wall biosynthesis
VTPRVSVVMPVFNGAPYLPEALDSALGQTFTDFELIAVDDGSTDGSYSVLREYAERDTRLRCVRYESNRGHFFAANEAIDMARGEYVARLDCDDVALPQRIARSVAVMDAHPDVGFLGTGFTLVTTDGRAADHLKHMTDGALRSRLVFNNCICHSSVMLRRSVLEDHQLRYADIPGSFDYDLWVRVLSHTRGVMIPESLVLYKRRVGSMSDQLSDELPAAADDISNRQMTALIGELTDDPTVFRSLRRLHGLGKTSRSDLRNVDLLLTIYNRVGGLPFASRREVRAARQQWIVRACSTLLRSKSAVGPDLPFLATLLRRDPVGLGRWLGIDVPRRIRRRVAHAHH